MIQLQIAPMHEKIFGATVRGVNLRNLTDDEFATIHAAFLKHGFLLFPDQHLSEEDHAAFGKRFGELEFGGIPIANQQKNEDGTFGVMFDLQSRVMRTNVGNEAWHTDSTYKPISSKAAMLSAVKVPKEGGETELADLRAGYETLDAETRTRISELSAFHSTNFSQANDIGDFPESGGEGIYASVYHPEAYLRPLVKIHPETGVPNLFVGRHAFGIPGFERTESRALLQSLLAHVVGDASRVYTHNWSEGDLLLWDNRRLLHRARPYEYSEPRYLIATRIAGDPKTELAYYPDSPEAEAGRKALATELDILRKDQKTRMYENTTASF